MVIEGTETPQPPQPPSPEDQTSGPGSEPGQGGMTSIRAIMEWALSEPKPLAADEEDPQDPHFKPWRRREVVHNSNVRHPCRAWSELGADLYIIKLRASLVKLLSEADSYSAGKVRVECIQGMRKLVSLTHMNRAWGVIIELV